MPSNKIFFFKIYIDIEKPAEYVSSEIYLYKCKMTDVLRTLREILVCKGFDFPERKRLKYTVNYEKKVSYSLGKTPQDK